MTTIIETISSIPNNALILLLWLFSLPIIMGIGAYIDYLWNEKGW